MMPDTLKNRGFTLFELMITVAIIAILAAVAMPSYRDYIKRNDRAEAKAIILENVQFLERNFVEAGNKYDKDAANNAISLPITQSPRTGTAKYNISANPLTASTYTLKAEPVSGGPMDGDGCGTLTFPHWVAKQAPASPVLTVA